MSTWFPPKSGRRRRIRFREQPLICEPARHRRSLPHAGRAAKTVVAILIRPYMRCCNRQANANILWSDIEHHEVLRQREWTIVVFADLTLDLRGGVEVMEEVVDDRETRLDQRKHLSRLARRSMHHGADAARRPFIVARALDQLRHRVEALVDQQVGILRIIDKESARR